MSPARGDILHVSGMRFLKRLSVVTNAADADRRIEKRVVDLDGWGIRFVVRSDSDDSVLVDHVLAPGSDHTLADAGRNGEIASILIDIAAADMTFDFAAPPLKRTIPVRYLPYTLIIDDGTRSDVAAEGYLVVRAKVTP